MKIELKRKKKRIYSILRIYRKFIFIKWIKRKIGNEGGFG
jgi:hypothetical protein